MKRAVCFILSTIVVLSFALGCAETIDLSGMSFEELVALKEQINLAIWNSEEWQEVTVPQGVWQIGKDIPAGYWTIKMVNDSGWNSWCAITYCSELDETKMNSKSGAKILYQQLSRPGTDYPAPEQIDIELKEGNYLIISESDMVFTPFAGKPDLGFK